MNGGGDGVGADAIEGECKSERRDTGGSGKM